MNFFHPHANFSYFWGLRFKTGNNTINICDKITLLSLNSNYYNQLNIYNIYNIYNKKYYNLLKTVKKCKPPPSDLDRNPDPVLELWFVWLHPVVVYNFHNPQPFARTQPSHTLFATKSVSYINFAEGNFGNCRFQRHQNVSTFFIMIFSSFPLTYFSTRGLSKAQ